MNQPSPQDIPSSTLERITAIVLDDILKSIDHKPAADIMSFDFGTQFNDAISGTMLSICKALTSAVRQCNKRYTVVREDNLTFLVIDAAVTQEATGECQIMLSPRLNIVCYTFFQCTHVLLFFPPLLVGTPLCGNSDTPCKLHKNGEKLRRG